MGKSVFGLIRDPGNAIAAYSELSLRTPLGA